ncbi:PHB depolymerase family esterase [Bdellovibrio sp. 22V]|uniref:alpha/beta hydrolase family esterase n=1 Tax=Bdellovibrio sp. 22V TaxID=3044166 RepID=UPI002542FBC6|nr:PHB depolymerase family esterase [Bdellovibrio sp. 22V]WII71464.1 PHB depolymerase family esterase [Bdellovibrio sp. 22V]
MLLKLSSFFILFLSCLLLLAARPAAATEISYSYYNTSTPASEYNLGGKRPLLLWLHGCRQTTEKFVDITDVVAKTQHLDPLIIAPFQKSKLNILKCWNFTSSEMQKRDGEFMQVIDEVKKHIDSGEVDPDRVFVGGFSSGAMFANHLALCFPDIFKGALIHSGAPFNVTGSMTLASARDQVRDALACAQTGAHDQGLASRRLKTLFYIHGKKDKIVPTFMGRNAFTQSVYYLDALDDKKFNKSFRVTHITSPQGYSVRFNDGSSATYLEIEGMSHRWSGSKPGSDFSSPETLSSIDVFLELTQQLR